MCPRLFWFSPLLLLALLFAAAGCAGSPTRETDPLSADKARGEAENEVAEAEPRQPEVISIDREEEGGGSEPRDLVSPADPEMPQFLSFMVPNPPDLPENDNSVASLPLPEYTLEIPVEERQNGPEETEQGAKPRLPWGMQRLLQAVSILEKGRGLLSELILGRQQEIGDALLLLGMVREQNEKLARQNALLEKELALVQEELLTAAREVSSGRVLAPADPGAAEAVHEEKGGTGEESRRHVYAVPQDVIAVTLNGNGWIFTGEQAGSPGIQFKARENAEAYTEFVFQTGELGEYVLEFRRQDLFTGEDGTEFVRVSVVTTEQFAEMLNIQKEGPGGDGPGIRPSPKGFIIADTYYNEERYDDALEEYLQNYVEGNSKVNHRIAELSFRFEDYDRAARFWRKNVYTDNETYREHAVSGLLRTAVRLNDEAVFDEFLPDLKDLRRTPLVGLLEEAARYQIEREKLQSAAGLLEEYVTRYYGSHASDWAYFTLGTLHERPGTLRDLKKAKYYYRVVLQDFPASSYYDQARERIRYIDTNFLHVQ